MPKNKKSKKNLKKNIRVKRINIPKNKLDDKLKNIINIKIDNSRKTNPRTSQGKTAQPQQQQTRPTPDLPFNSRVAYTPASTNTSTTINIPTAEKAAEKAPETSPETKQELKNIQQGLLRLENKTNLYNENFQNFANNYPSLEYKRAWNDVPDLEEETNIKRAEQQMPNIEPQSKYDLGASNKEQTYGLTDLFDIDENNELKLNHEKVEDTIGVEGVQYELEKIKDIRLRKRYANELIPIYNKLKKEYNVDYFLPDPETITSSILTGKLNQYTTNYGKIKRGELDPEKARLRIKQAQQVKETKAQKKAVKTTKAVKSTKKKTAEEQELEELDKELTAKINKK